MIHRTSLAVTQLLPFFYEEPLPKATGFIYRFGQIFGLVTNWHVLSNKNPITNIHLNPDHKVPTRVEFHVTLEDCEQGTLYFAPYNLPTLIDGRPTWWQHPGYLDDNQIPQYVDLAVLPLNNVMSDFDAVRDQIISLNAHVIVNADADGKPESVEHGYARVGAEVFILGFPHGLSAQGIVPVWKRGSIASEPLINIDGNIPIFFVDAATRHGMSGSPILYFGNDITKEDGTPVVGGFDRREPWLMGVYAGRRGSSEDEYSMALGRGWRRPLVDEVFMYQVEGGLPATAQLSQEASSSHPAR